MLQSLSWEGIRVADESYLQGLSALCAQHDWLLIVDEVQTGNARTGTYFACMAAGIQPDVITTAKGLGMECQLVLV